MDKLKMHSLDLSQDNIAKVRQLFPNCVTEAKDSNGNLRLLVDFDHLRQELTDSIVEGPQERYQLNWPGKREAIATANAPIAKTLRPFLSESVDFDNTKNLFIEGDNLEALKLLQETYLGKVKMIYIDPPYNTGNDFVYEDDFAENAAEFLERSNQRDDDGNRLVANTAANGRFHSAWLTMMYPRLKLARNLLTDDGIIFVSIDDHEVASLKKMLDEIFGHENFEALVAWRRRHNQPNDKSKMIGKVAENIVVFAKSSIALKAAGTYYGLPLSSERVAEYTNEDGDPNGPWTTNPWKAAVGRGGTKYTITSPTGKQMDEVWYGNRETFEDHLECGRVHWTSGGDGFPRIKIYLRDAEKNGQAAINFFTHQNFGSNQEGSRELSEIFGTDGLFDNPKPTKLIQSLIKLSTSNEDCVLDFFAGSGTTSHAVMKQNAQDGGNRKVISVQLPEPTQSASKIHQSGFNTISELTKDRIKRSGQKIIETECHPDWNKDIGFRVLKIDSSNMADVYYAPDQTQQADLLDAVSNIRPDRTAADLLFQVLIDWGVDLMLPISSETIQGKQVFFVDGNALVACFDTGVTEELVTELAKREPLRVVFRDNGFLSDSIKINVEQIFKQLSPLTDVKAI